MSWSSWKNGNENGKEESTKRILNAFGYEEYNQKQKKLDTKLKKKRERGLFNLYQVFINVLSGVVFVVIQNWKANSHIHIVRKETQN